MSTLSILNIGLYLLFVGLGYLLSRRMNPPQTSQGWVGWIILVILAGGICVGAYAVNINDRIVLPMNDMFQAIGIGILIGFVIAKSRQNQPKNV